MAITAQSADGKLHEFPDGTDRGVVDRAMKQYAAQAQGGADATDAAIENAGNAPLVGTLVDMARSVPGGFAQGMSAIMGAPGDFVDLGSKVGATVRNFVTGENNTAPVPRLLPNTKEINRAVSEPFGGYYDPKTVPGEYAQTTASFLPNAIGPGGLPGAVARVALPGMATESARQLTKGTKYEPYATAAGALLGGIAAGRGTTPKASVLSMDDLGKAKVATYKASEQAGVVIRPDSFQKFATDLGADITRRNPMIAESHPKTFEALKLIQAEADTGVAMSLERAELIRQNVRDSIYEAAPKDARVVKQVRDAVDGYFDNLTPGDTLAGDPQTAVRLLKDARSLAQREFKAREIQRHIDLAEAAAVGTNSTSGLQQALKREFTNLEKTLINDPGLASTYTAAERAAIRRVMNGGKLEGALRHLGKLAPQHVLTGGIGAGVGATLGTAMFGPGLGTAIGAAAPVFAGGLARAGGAAITTKNASQAEQLMRAGQAGAGATALPRQNVLLGGLLSQARP